MTTVRINDAVFQMNEGNRTLLDVLRNELGLKGAKLGCGEGECGACTVLLDANPICACLQLASSTECRDIRTVEYVSETDIGRQVVDALVAAGAVQCGFCTPGIVVAATSHFTLGSPGGLDAALEGNLCRCTGYAKIRSALERIVTTPRELGCETIWRDMPLADALIRLAADPALIPMAGGTDLMVRYEHNLSGRRFLDLNRLNEPRLASIQCSNEGLTIGPLVTWSDLLNNSDVIRVAPLLADAARNVAGQQVRNMGTLAGNIATASPAGDGLVALNALGAELEISHHEYQLRVPLVDFVRKPGLTTLRPGELITAIAIPVPPVGQDVRQFFRKVGPRRAQAVSKVAFGMVANVEDGVVKYLRMCFGAVGPIPLICPETTSFMVNRTISAENLREAKKILSSEIAPIDDYRSSATYRREVATRLFADAIFQLIGRDF